jgi:hypothetical protein
MSLYSNRQAGELKGILKLALHVLQHPSETFTFLSGADEELGHCRLRFLKNSK